MKRGSFISSIMLSTVVLFNTGCMERFFVDEKPPQKVSNHQATPTYQNREPIVTTPTPKEVKNNTTTAIKNNTNQDVECSAELTVKKSDCDRGTISETELKHTPKIGEIHTLRSIRGKTIHIGERSNGFTFPEYKNKVIILEIFGKNCPHCLKELSTIKKIRNRYKGKLEVIAIQAQDRMTRAEARDYINRNRIRYPIIEGDDATNLQYFIQNTYEWRGILPYILVVKDGRTEFSYSGEVDYEELKRDIDTLF